jgi:GNAT superfamily N-acetyltransferase
VTIAPEQAKDLGIETLALARPVETGRADGAVSVLLAHAISTRTHGDVVTDADMDYPKDWRARSARVAEPVGHQEGGKTVALHSFAVLPRVHRCGLGQMLMRAFLDQMKSCGLVQRVALICQEVGSLPVSVGCVDCGGKRAQEGVCAVGSTDRPSFVAAPRYVLSTVWVQVSRQERSAVWWRRLVQHGM